MMEWGWIKAVATEESMNNKLNIITETTVSRVCAVNEPDV